LVNQGRQVNTFWAKIQSCDGAKKLVCYLHYRPDDILKPRRVHMAAVIVFSNGEL